MSAIRSNIEIYIPRILGNVSRTNITRAFNNLNIGNTAKIDMHRKVNENGHRYSFAFIRLELYNTGPAERLKTLLNTKGVMHLVYDEEAFQYWEVKQHVPKNSRKRVDNAPIQPREVAKIIINKWNDTVPECKISYCGITQQDRIDMIEEYEELQREISQLIC
tara:strand:- start:5645 stop:6133 length:489 start_codon:yes stop_codon:yes gene_type:complete